MKHPKPGSWWEIRPNTCGERPVFTGTRLTVDTVRALLVGGFTVDRVSEMYPEIPVESIRRVK